MTDPMHTADADLDEMFGAMANEIDLARAADVELTPEQVIDALAAKAIAAEAMLVDAMAEEADLAETVKLLREEALAPLVEISARYEASKKETAIARARLIELGAEFVQGEERGAPLDAFTYLQFKAMKSTVISASDAEVMTWLRANMPALILPESFDPETVMKAAQSLPAAVRPSWVVTTEAKQPQVKSKALAENVAALRAQTMALLDAEIEALIAKAEAGEVPDATA